MINRKPFFSSFRSFLWYCVEPYRWHLLGCLLPMLYSAMHVSLEPYLLKILVDRVTHTAEADLGNILKAQWKIACGFPILGMCIIFSWRVKDYFFRILMPGVKARCVETLFGYVIQHSHRFFQEHFSGQLANKMREVQSGIEEILEVFLDGFRGIFLILISILFVFRINGYLAGILFFSTVLFIGLGFVLYQKAIFSAEKFSESRSVLFGKLGDSIANHSIIRFFSSHKFAKKFLSFFLKKNKNTEYQLRLEFMIISGVLGFIFVVCITLLIFGLLYFCARKLISIGDFTFVMWVSISVLDQTWMMIEKLARIPQNIGICKNSLSIIFASHEVLDVPKCQELIVKKGVIEFQNVCFSHHGISHLLFDHLSIKIHSGSKVGLVGYSGSGKSTWIHLLVRLFDLQGGHIFIDEQDVAQVSQSSLRKMIGVIPQDPTLFHRSLRDNIRYGDLTASDAEVEAAAKSAHAHDFILQTPLGYDSLVGERGIKLSGGQRQRIVIARAILKNAPILVLDEATSALDSVTEGLIQESLNQLMKNKTSLVIAHRLSTLLTMDRILVFDQGKIVEDGTHAALFRKKGYYFKLWNNQVAGFLPDGFSSSTASLNEEEKVF